MVESERLQHPLWVISVVGPVNVTSSNEHCSVIANPLESIQLTVSPIKQRLNCAYLLALWDDAVSPFAIFQTITDVKCTPSSILRNELVKIQIFLLTHTYQWIVPRKFRLNWVLLILNIW